MREACFKMKILQIYLIKVKKHKLKKSKDDRQGSNLKSSNENWFPSVHPCSHQPGSQCSTKYGMQSHTIIFCHEDLCFVLLRPSPKVIFCVQTCLNYK